MGWIKQQKLRKLREQGLSMIHDGLLVQLEHAQWHLALPDLPEKDRQYWKVLQDVTKYWSEEAQKALNGQLHF